MLQNRSLPTSQKLSKLWRTQSCKRRLWIQRKISKADFNLFNFLLVDCFYFWWGRSRDDSAGFLFMCVIGWRFFCSIVYF